MSKFVYLLGEGVQDAAFIGRVLQQFFGGKKVDKIENLDEPQQRWFQQFKWPVKNNIARLNVPAPIMYRLTNPDSLVAVRNAEGISKIIATLEDDFDTFSRIDAFPEAIGILLDSDDEPQAKRYADFRRKIRDVNLSLDGHPLMLPDSIGTIGTGNPPLGIYALPGQDQEGALEDVLLALGRSVYPELTQTADAYVKNWQTRVLDDDQKDWKEFKSASGAKKATVAAMTALLKPGKSATATIEDNRWISPSTQNHDLISPFLHFIAALITNP